MPFLVGTRFDFIGHRRPAEIFSAAAVIISLLAILLQGFNLGVDFTGGTLVEVVYPHDADLPAIRSVLARHGYAEAVVQRIGGASDVLIRIANQPGQASQKVGDALVATLSMADGTQLHASRMDFVGPQVGQELFEEGGLAMLFALIAIFVYVMLRFEWKFSAGAIVALLHDVTITLGVFAIFGFEVDLTVLAAMLALIGYSLNDTIVVFDRIRENFRKLRRLSPTAVVNDAINQTLGRTVMTSTTTLLTMVALFVAGGDLIRNFSLAMIIGIAIGTYSSIFVASNIALQLGLSRQDLVRAEPEHEENAREERRRPG